MAGAAKPQHPSRRVTLKVVAKLAGVSPITVSNVVNGRFEAMSEKTRTKVEAAIEKLNYRVNLAARGLRQAHHYCVALIIVDQRRNFLAQPAHHQIAAGLSNILNTRGYALAIEGVPPEHIYDISYLDRLSVDALCLIVSGRLPDRQAMLERLQATGQPIVVFHEPPMEASSRTCYIRSDDYQGGVLAAEHVLANGAKHILLLLPHGEWASMNQRGKGVEAALAASGKEYAFDTVRVASLPVQEVAKTLNVYCEHAGMPDTVIAGNDILAAASQRYFLERGIKIPQQVRIVGFGGYDLTQYLYPSPTSIRVPAYDMGQTAGLEVLNAIEKGEFSSRDIVLPVDLVQGEST
jgi:LacI family transcriptional regulator